MKFILIPTPKASSLIFILSRVWLRPNPLLRKWRAVNFRFPPKSWRSNLPLLRRLPQQGREIRKEFAPLLLILVTVGWTLVRLEFAGRWRKTLISKPPNYWLVSWH